MTTDLKLQLKRDDASPPIFLSGKCNHSKFAREMLSDRKELNRRLELSKENTMRRDATQKTAISEELSSIKRAEFVEKKQRQQLRNECEELRQLAEHLRLAAISKELTEHMSKVNRSRHLAQKAKALGHQRAEQERLDYLAKEREQELDHKEQQRKLRESLALQIEENRKRRQEECIQTQAERELRMAMQQQIEDEDRAEQMQLELEKVRKRNDMIQFIEDKNEYREFQSQQEKQELERLLQTQSQLDERKQKLQEERLEARRKHEEISVRLGHQVFEIENQKRQRDNLLLDLLQAEYKAKGDERFRQQLQQDEMVRQRTKQELERYRLEVMARNMEEMQQKREEIAARQLEALQKPEELEREKEIDEHRRRKDHGAILLSMIEENHRKRAQATADNVQFFDMKAKADAELQQRIQRERLQMLGDVPASVLRYLPNHVLSSSDREHFGIQIGKSLGGGDA